MNSSSRAREDVARERADTGLRELGEDNGALRSEAWKEEDWLTWVDDGDAEREDNGRLSREDKKEFETASEVNGALSTAEEDENVLETDSSTPEDDDEKTEFPTDAEFVFAFQPADFLGDDRALFDPVLGCRDFLSFGVSIMSTKMSEKYAFS